ncbi:hypothetical protein BGZ65_008264 [Modicella reniformis]|uniref:RING-type domain-containing protein n=1 Tax=Modicella reniformis TaxID=1440133 RepID=A0A9P6IMS4_9FUNG|nr:hypothetical protein BGZ65_008264 [Modicella reniformis]
MNDGSRVRDIEDHGEESHTDEETDEDYDFLDDGDHDDSSLLERERGDSSPSNGAHNNHPLYFGPAFNPAIEQSLAQLQLQRQIEQQLEQQQRHEYWQQQYLHQQQQNQQQSSQPGSQQLSLNDLILPSAISGLGGLNVGSGVQGGSPSGHMRTADSVQKQMYRNNNMYNLLSGLSVNALLTEVQRAGTLDLSVLEQELDDVEGGWVDIDDEDDEEERNDVTDNNGHKALACSVNLKKSTLRLVKNFSTSNDPSVPVPSHLRPNYRLDFTFDSLTPCDVKLFWVIKEVEENGELGFRLRRLHHLPQPTTYHFPAGMNQRFISPILPLYTMSLPELTMQGLPSTSMRMYYKRHQRLLQQANMTDKDHSEAHDLDGEGDGDDVMATGGRAQKNKNGKTTPPKSSKAGSDSTEGYNARKQGGQYSQLEDDAFKPIMEDQYFSLVILIEATKEYKATGPVRSLPIPVADSPGLYLVENQAISTFACFNINSEGGFEIKVMKQKVWINSTNYLIQDIYGFTDSVMSAPTKTTENTAGKKAQLARQGSSSEKHLSRSLSRMSRAESIASRVDELTKDRPKRKKRNSKQKSEGNATTNAESKTEETSRVRRASKESAITDPGTTETGPEVRRSSMVAASTQRRDSEYSVRSVVSRTTSVNGTGVRAGTSVDEEQEDDKNTNIQPASDNEQGQEEEDEEGEDGEEPGLVLLDAPECVICLSDVKDTIVLPCRHFCVCNECGDVLRRRVPQRCPICRRGFEALLHIA